jgi:hypothetical protein
MAHEIPEHSWFYSHNKWRFARLPGGHVRIEQVTDGKVVAWGEFTPEIWASISMHVEGVSIEPGAWDAARARQVAKG